MVRKRRGNGRERFEEFGGHRPTQFSNSISESVIRTRNDERLFRTMCNSLGGQTLVAGSGLQADVDEAKRQLFDFFGTQFARMLSGEFPSLVRKPPKATTNALGESGPFEAVMSPACAILVNGLSSAGKEFLTIRVGNS